jgi:hypothetical protein
MTLFTQEQTEKLLANCQEQIKNNDAGHSDIDFKPAVKLFTPDAHCTWQYPSSAGLFGYPYPRPAPKSQAHGPDSPYGLHPLLHPSSKSGLPTVFEFSTGRASVAVTPAAAFVVRNPT